MESFATLADYEARYGAQSDPERVETLLGDASSFIAAQSGLVIDPDDETQASNLKHVTCAIVRRAMSAGELAGYSNYSQGADGYSASVTVANPTEDFWLTSAEKKTLGIGKTSVSQAWPYTPHVSGWYW